MARRSGYDSGWGYFPKTTPRRVKDGLRARSRRGAIGDTWWSRRWVEVLESFNIGARLSRGRSYARRGQVMSIEVVAGQVTARVQGSMPQPYRVQIRLATLSDDEWARVVDAMAARAVFAARLLAGEMPQDIEDAFKQAGVPLFPERHADLKTDCSCPDWSNPCKHIAAVYYILAEQFDADPFLLFTLRGRNKNQIIDALRARRAAAAPEAAAETEEAPASEAQPEPLPVTEDFWIAGAALDTFAVRIGAAQAESAVLRQLAGASFAAEPVAASSRARRESVADALARAYAAVAAAAAQKAWDNAPADAP